MRNNTTYSHFSTDSNSSYPSLPKPIYPKYIFPKEEDASSCNCYEDSSREDSSSFSFTNMASSTSRVFDPNVKTGFFLDQSNSNKFINNPTAIKETSNQDVNRRVTLKLKNGLPDNGSKPKSTASNPLCTNTLKRRMAESNSTNFQNYNLRKDINVVPDVKVVTFVKIEKGRIMEKRKFRCYKEEQLQLPSNLNKFLQKTENDDDVETDDETLEYYINKVRAQLEEAVEAEKFAKKKAEELERLEKMKKEELEQKENVQKYIRKNTEMVNFNINNPENVKKIDNIERIRSKTLKVLSNK